jgi:hypothetical protein
VLRIADEKWFAWRRLNPRATDAEREEFKTHCGHNDATALQKAAGDELQDAIDAMCATPARSLRGVIAKARVFDTTCRQDGEVHTDDEELERSIIDDLLAMEAQS